VKRAVFEVKKGLNQVKGMGIGSKKGIFGCENVQLLD
jgi:hypothetical protein